jgi:hypothetical protein
MPYFPSQNFGFYENYSTIKENRESSLTQSDRVLMISSLKHCICGGTNPPYPQFYAPEGRVINHMRLFCGHGGIKTNKNICKTIKMGEKFAFSTSTSGHIIF